MIFTIDDGTTTFRVAFAVMDVKPQPPLTRFLVFEALLCVIVSILFAWILLLLDTFGVGTLVANSSHTGTTLIFLLGGVTSLAPVLWAISIECLKSQGR